MIFDLPEQVPPEWALSGIAADCNTIQQKGAFKHINIKTIPYSKVENATGGEENEQLETVIHALAADSETQFIVLKSVIRIDCSKY